MSDAFTHHIYRTNVVRSLKLYHFKTASESALDVIVDATINRISEIAREASCRAAYCGRTEVNAYDLIISLGEFEISISSLFAMINSIKQVLIPPFDYIISPYPIVSFSEYYKKQAMMINQALQKKSGHSNYSQTANQFNLQQNIQTITDSIINDIFVPFRSNTTISYFSAENIINTQLNNSNNNNNYNINQPNTGMINLMAGNGLIANTNSQAPSADDESSKLNDYIPYFFPKLPPDYTYDETPMTDSLSEAEASILAKSREDDQRESKESLAQLNKSSLSDKLYDNSEFELNLLNPPEMNKPIGKYADNKSGIYQMEGENPGVDPEFMPKLEAKDVNDSLQSNSKDTKTMVNILLNSHKKEGKNDNDAKNDD